MRRVVFAGFAAVLLCGCTHRVWVKDGATQADFLVDKGDCLSDSYSRVPSDQRVASFGGGYSSPIYTTCSGFGTMGSCVTTGGQYTPPVNINYDANAGVRDQVFSGCMYHHGWVLQERKN